MSLFDNHASPEAIEEHYQELKTQKKIQEDIVYCLSPGACIIEIPDTESFISQVEEMVHPSYQVLGDDLMAEMLKKSQGRPIIRWDVRFFRKDDAIGSMYKLSQQPSDPKPIVIIENITDIPDGDRTVYDDPVLVENVLLHSWKNDTIHLTHHQAGAFQLNRQDYTVLFPVLPGDLNKLYHQLSDGIALIKDK